MKVKELRELTNEELNNKIYSLKEELFNRAYMVQRERELGIK